ncbi:MAG TPA: DUF5691 domain-containing protein [Asanoa sp.]
MSAPTWPDVVAAALVGTARSGADADALLDTVAARALRRRAGLPLAAAGPLPPPAPVDETPTLGRPAAARIADLLEADGVRRSGSPVRDTAGRVEMIAEWSAAAARGGRRVPAELVPAFLEAARRHRSLRPWVAPVAGPLAGWLAAQRVEWSYISDQPARPAAAAWDFGTTAQRVAYLGAQRHRDPGGARALLAAAWDAEPPEGRAALLGTLAVNLSTADEQLLEQALDDRRRQVRDVALDLLARLPDSAHAARMSARALAAVDPATLRVNPPAGCDRAMRRDGVAPRPPAGTGERAWWLEEILARTPLPVWPRDLLDRDAGEWAPTLRRGLARAAAAQGDGGWAAALVDWLTAEVVARRQPADRLLLEALYETLPVDDLAARAATALRDGLIGATDVGVDRVLARCPAPWPPAVADAVFRALDDHLARGGAAWRVTAVCELAALRLPPGQAPRAAALAQRLHDAHPRDAAVASVAHMAAALTFRREMLAELAAGPTEETDT